MARGVNKVILIGNLGADPETRYSQAGTPITRLRIATAERRKQGEQWVDHTEWHSVTCFGKNAENAGQYLRKGSKVYVEGSLRTSSWDKDGEKRYRTEVVANDLQFLDPRGAQQPRQQPNESGWNAPATPEPAGFDDDIDSIPF